MPNPSCECCKREKPIMGVACSSLGPISLSYCAECLENSAEPKWLIENTIVCCNGRAHMSAGWDAGIQFFEDGAYHPASEVNVTEETIAKFWKDFAKAEEKRYAYIDCNECDSPAEGAKKLETGSCAQRRHG